MRFVSIKTLEQQAVLSLHRARQGFVRARTAQANQIRGLMSEFGLIIPQGIGYVSKRVPGLLADAGDGLPGKFAELMRLLLGQLAELDGLVDELERQINQWHRDSPDSRKLAKVPGIGPITASALVASAGDAREFSSARQFSAWIGIVPQQHSSGGKQTLLGISKRGDCYLRTLLIHGARAVIRSAMDKPNEGSWLHGLLLRRNPNVAAVALANKNARVVWALLAQDRQYQADYKRAEVAA